MGSFTNEAGWDRALRIVVGGVLLYLGWAGIIGGTLGVVFRIVGFLPLLTGLFGYCAIYALLGVRTCQAPAVGGSSHRA
jgi:DUF2892 family protein